MTKNPHITNLLSSLAKEIGMHPENQAQGKCVACSQEALPRCTTEAGRREFAISGFCEVCYDAMWAEKGK